MPKVLQLPFDWNLDNLINTRIIWNINFILISDRFAQESIIESVPNPHCDG
jgi:hypothetical protein